MAEREQAALELLLRSLHTQILFGITYIIQVSTESMQN